MCRKKTDFVDLFLGFVGLCIFALVAFGFLLGTICIAVKSKFKTGKWWV